MTVIYNMYIDRADKPWIGDRRFTEQAATTALLKFWSARKFPETNAKRTRERGGSLVQGHSPTSKG